MRPLVAWTPETARPAWWKYAVVTIVDPFIEPFRTIPNAYKTLMAYMRLNRLEHLEDKDVIACFEREYDRDGTDYMDVYIAVK